MKTCIYPTWASWACTNLAEMHCKVKDKDNCHMVLKLLASVGLAIPTIANFYKALMDRAKEYSLLGDTATTNDIEACGWDWTTLSRLYSTFSPQTWSESVIPDVKVAGYPAGPPSLTLTQPVRLGRLVKATSTGGWCSMLSAVLVATLIQGAFLRFKY